MLKDLRMHATIAVHDLGRARTFYEEKLGLTPSQDTPGGLVYEVGGGTKFLLFPSSSAGTAQNTVMGFNTPDLKAEVAALQAKGVVFEEYDYPGFKTENGIATTPVGWAAWFKDSEGNIIGIVQFK